MRCEKHDWSAFKKYDANVELIDMDKLNHLWPLLGASCPPFLEAFVAAISLRCCRKLLNFIFHEATTFLT